jgi:hypothetical protein
MKVEKQQMSVYQAGRRCIAKVFDFREERGNTLETQEGNKDH